MKQKNHVFIKIALLNFFLFSTAKANELKCNIVIDHKEVEGLVAYFPNNISLKSATYTPANDTQVYNSKKFEMTIRPGAFDLNFELGSGTNSSRIVSMIMDISSMNESIQADITTTVMLRGDGVIITLPLLQSLNCYQNICNGKIGNKVWFNSHYLNYSMNCVPVF